MAYLKKHALVHQFGGDTAGGSYHDVTTIPPMPFHMPSMRNYAPIPGPFSAMFPELDKSHINKLREFYFQQNERMSAFQYVRNNALENFNKM